MSDHPTVEGVLEGVLVVRAGCGALLDPARLDRWLCSSVVVDGDEVRCVVEEEYGYRRHLAWRVAEHDPHHCLRLEARRVEREWDGSDGVPVGPVSSPQRWEEPALSGTVLEIRIDGELARVGWGGFPAGARDDLRRQGGLLRFAGERAVEAGFARAMDTVEARADVPGREWLGEALLLVEPPGARWQLLGATGRVLLSVGDRRLVASCVLPGSELPAAMLDVRVERTRGSDGTLHGTLQVGPGVDHVAARRWLAQALPELAAGTSVAVPAA